MKHLKIYLAVLALFALVYSCGKKTEETPTPVTPKEKPSALVYATNTALINEGTAFTSVVPTVKGTTPMTFSLTSTPDAKGTITINATTGVISAQTTTAVGIYDLDVKVSNEAGSADFTKALKLTVMEVKKATPSNLVYSPNAISTTFGKAISSATPSVVGLTPFTFAILKTTPDAAGNISIASSGVITANDKLAVGVYQVDVSVTNSVGKTDFVKPLTIEVKTAPVVTKVTYIANIKPLMVSMCTPCHTTGAQAGTMNYSRYDHTKAQINRIISETQSGSMPPSSPKLTTTQINLLKQWITDGLLEN